MPSTSHARPGLPATLLGLAALACWLLAGAARAASPAAEPALSRHLVGAASQHCVVAGETLLSIAARYGEPLSRLLRDNRLDARDALHPGRCLDIDNRHVVPAQGPADGVLINVPQRMLFRWHDGVLAGAHPVAVGRPDWPTPIGDFHVETLRRDPVWHVPVSIQQEMLSKGEPGVREVPSGPENPLGHAWIGLSISAYGIHGTNAPSSIYSFRTHGCIRLHDEQATELLGSVQRGTPVRIVYQPWLLAELPDASLWLEADPDIYRRGSPDRYLAALRALATRHGLDSRIDWQRARRILQRHAGLAEPVSVPASAACAPCH